MVALGSTSSAMLLPVNVRTKICIVEVCVSVMVQFHVAAVGRKRFDEKNSTTRSHLEMRKANRNGKNDIFSITK
jgi:hypothetical protein